MRLAIQLRPVFAKAPTAFSHPSRLTRTGMGDACFDRSASLLALRRQLMVICERADVSLGFIERPDALTARRGHPLIYSVG